MSKFKVGDRIRLIANPKRTDVVITLPGMTEYDRYNFCDAEKGMQTQNSGWERQKYWELVDEPQFQIVDWGYHAHARVLHEYAMMTNGPVYKNGEIKPKKSMTKTLSTMFKKLVDADTQTLSKAGYINGDLELTSEGRDELMVIMFDAHKKELVAVAQAKLDEEKAAK